ncbi:MAG: hypothetical protein AB1894_27755 [Chloroflexota bacterium]
MNVDTISLANYAVKAAKERFGLTLDFSELTLPNFENLLVLATKHIDDYKSEGKVTYKIIQRTATVWGSYLGEVMRHELGGEWLLTLID